MTVGGLTGIISASLFSLHALGQTSENSIIHPSQWSDSEHTAFAIKHHGRSLSEMLEHLEQLRAHFPDQSAHEKIVPSVPRTQAQIPYQGALKEFEDSQIIPTTDIAPVKARAPDFPQRRLRETYSLVHQGTFLQSIESTSVSSIFQHFNQKSMPVHQSNGSYYYSTLNGPFQKNNLDYINLLDTIKLGNCELGFWAARSEHLNGETGVNERHFGSEISCWANEYVFLTYTRMPKNSQGRPTWYAGPGFLVPIGQWNDVPLLKRDIVFKGGGQFNIVSYTQRSNEEVTFIAPVPLVSIQDKKDRSFSIDAGYIPIANVIFPRVKAGVISLRYTFDPFFQPAKQ